MYPSQPDPRGSSPRPRVWAVGLLAIIALLLLAACGGPSSVQSTACVPTAPQHATVYVNTTNARDEVWAIDAITGKKALPPFAVGLGGGLAYGSVTVANGIAYLGTDDGNFSALDGATLL
jgi:PQQ-like domain